MLFRYLPAVRSLFSMVLNAPLLLGIYRTDRTNKYIIVIVARLAIGKTASIAANPIHHVGTIGTIPAATGTVNPIFWLMMKPVAALSTAIETKSRS